MGFLINIFIWMIKIMLYCMLFILYLMYYICYLVVSLIISMITGKRVGNPKKFNVNFESKRNNNKKASWKEDDFEKEANILGLSKEDKRIAREEGMSPLDYIEAEENDDDELDEDR